MENENTAAFDHAMLKILLIEFMRSTKTPMKIANDKKFRAIFQFLRPDMDFPTTEELEVLNALEYRKFNAWGKIQSQVNDGLSNERFKMAVKYSTPSEESTSSGVTLDTILASTSSEGTSESEKLIKSEPIYYDLEDEGEPESPKPTISELNALFAPEKKKKKTSPGVSPCIVCHLNPPPSKFKMLTKNSGLLIIFICVTEGLYDMEEAGRIAKNTKFWCCLGHLERMHESALHHLDVVDPKIDVHSENPKILKAYHVVNRIKGFQDLPSNRRKYIFHFLNQVTEFFLQLQDEPVLKRRRD